jgi:glyoxylase-like metal-dependent hydrolase (beta-lactamase superfamily II)
VDPHAIPFETGRHQVGDDCHAWLQPDGGWGWSNAGLVVGDGASLLVDTLFDLTLTRAMLDGLAPLTDAAPIATLVNTHANGDHCYGNELVTGAEIVASDATAREITDVPPASLAALKGAPGPVGALFEHFFGAFDFEGITLTPPTRTFSDRLGLDVAGTRVDLVEVGPAHTEGDTIVHVPDAGVVFTGDICFIEGTPIVWAGPLDRWIAACDLIVDLDPAVVVPGHGPVTDTAGVVRVRDYLAWVDGEARDRFARGMTATEAARDLAGTLAASPFAAWGEEGRIAVNVETAFRHLDPGHEPANVVDLFQRMAELEGWAPPAPA